ncbi:MAG: hypothetical protein EPO46_02125 [Lysobacter sp.]|nr:MAG: hypothetical protein EPO46_02125 [Lysobacter sp.]
MTLRTLLACTVAAMVLLVLTIVLSRLQPGMGGIMTRIGQLPTTELLAVAIAMGLGGYLGGRPFRFLAPALVVLIGFASLIAAWALAPPQVEGTGSWLVRNNLLGLLLTATAAVLAAWVGEYVARRWPPPALARLR